MSSPGRSLPIELTIADPVDVTAAGYHRHFRQVPGVEVKSGRLADIAKMAESSRPYDALILPMPNCHGVPPFSGLVKDIFSWLGNDFVKQLQDQIQDEAFGELLPGASIVVETSQIPLNTLRPTTHTQFKSSDGITKSTSVPVQANFAVSGFQHFKYIIVVCAFRVLTSQGDSMAWLDPVYIPEDWAYNTMRSALQTALKHCKRSKVDPLPPRSVSEGVNVTKLRESMEGDTHTLGAEEVEGDSISRPLRLLCPDFHSLRAHSVDSTATLGNALDATAKQMLFAWRGMMQAATANTQTRRNPTWADAILLQRLLLNKDSSEGAGSNQTDLLASLSQADLEDRVLYSIEELQTACQWVRDPMSPERALSGAKLIANTFCSDSGHGSALTRADIARIVTNKDTGCLPSLLNFVQSGQIRLYVEIPPEDLIYGDEIGTGTAGSVVRATWRGMPVAVKKFKGVELGDFLKELSIMSIVQHPNLVECYGGCTRNKDTMYIVQELMDCNISDVLRLKPIIMDLGIRLRIGIEVAKGVSFLHSHCNLIHRDLKSLNLLAQVSENGFVVKVCDFGVSRIVDRRKTMTGNVGTVSWIAPEVFEQRKYTEKADVYSFGIVLWELLTRRVPFADIHSFSIPVAVIKGDRPSIPKDCPSGLKKLIRECWQPKASKRPPFPKVIEILTKILEQAPPSQRQQETFNIAPLMLRKKNSIAQAQGFSRHQKQVEEVATPASVTPATMTPVDTPVKPTTPASTTESPSLVSKRGNDSSHSTPKRKRPITPETSSLYSIESLSAESSPSTAASSDQTGEMPEKVARKLSNMKMEIVGSPSVTHSPLEAAQDDLLDQDHSSSPHTSSNPDSESPDFDALVDGSSTLTTSTSSISLQRRALSSRHESTVISPLAHTRTVTCTVPDKWAPPIAKLEVQVNKYFSKLNQDLDNGTIMVNNERYLLFRAKSLAVDFFNLVQTLFNFDNSEQSLEFAQNFLYDLGTAIGKSDAQHFLESSAEIDDPVARNNAGLVHIAYTGMAFINLRPESTYSKHPEDECLLYEYTFSFESDSWSKRRIAPGGSNDTRTDFCTCMMSAGYMSGWGEGATGDVRATAEISCRSKGDHACLFVRSMPYRLEHMVRKASGGNADPLPRFLKNRADTTQPGRRPQTDVVQTATESEGSWFQQGFRQLFKRTKKAPIGEANTGSGKMSSKFNVKSILPAEMTIEEIDIRASRELNSFFIDPTTATVEMADERCVLLRGDALAHGFYEMVQELFGLDDEGQLESDADKHMSRQFAWKFLFDLGKTIATSNLAWFSEKIGLPANAIERINSLPVNMAYFGWCDLIIRSGHSHRELTKAKDAFVIVCEVANSFEAASWSSKTSHAHTHSAQLSPEKTPVCFMHAGYLSGWFESALKTPCVAIETSCGVQTGGSCFFTIAHSTNIKRVISSYPNNTSLGLNTATAGGVLPLLAKFKEKRRESTPVKVSLGTFGKPPSAEQVPAPVLSSPSPKQKSSKSSTGEMQSPSPPPPRLDRSAAAFSTSSDSITIPKQRLKEKEAVPVRDNGAPKREKAASRSSSQFGPTASVPATTVLKEETSSKRDESSPRKERSSKTKHSAPSPSNPLASSSQASHESSQQSSAEAEEPVRPASSRKESPSIRAVSIDLPHGERSPASSRHEGEPRSSRKHREKEAVTKEERIANFMTDSSEAIAAPSTPIGTPKHKRSKHKTSAAEDVDGGYSSKEDTPSKRRIKTVDDKDRAERTPKKSRKHADE